MAPQASNLQVPSTNINTPALVVLLGSTPGKAGLELCRHMLTLSPSDCRRVALVHIDTADDSGDVAAFYKEYEGLFRILPLRIGVPISINYAPLPIEPEHTYIPSKIPQAFANGAGGIRNNGHVAAAFDHPKIKQTLEAALQHLELLGTNQGEKSVREVHANIVAFLGGGTGSGILTDIAVMVRQLLLERLYEQRINLFCILPDWIQGTNNNDINWRKSNATACLLELLALSLAGDARRQLTYRKHMLNYPYDVSADAIANEVYLIGRTSMGNAEDAARIVGLDLFQRIMDGSGIGSLEHDTWSNRRSLGATDDRGLPTMFATSCPMEVRFPAQETATAFAQIATSYLLPKLVGMEPPAPDVDEEMREQWKEEWHAVAELTEQTQGKDMAVRLADEFSFSEFQDAPVETLDSLWNEVKRRRKATAQRIETVIRRKRLKELEEINRVPVRTNNERLSPITRQINHLRLLQEEYNTVLQTLKGIPDIEAPEQPQPRHSILYVVPIIGKSLRLKHARELCNEYNDSMRSDAEKVRYNYLQQTVEDLLGRVEALLNEKLNWYRFRDEHLNRSCKELATAGFSSAAWHGKLDMSHPHQRHIFDIHVLQQNNRSLATESLFMAVTFPDTEDAVVATANAHHLFNEEVVKLQIDRYIDSCTAFLNKGSLNDEGDLTADEDLEMQSREQFVDRVVSFFTAYYMSSFIGNRADKKPPMNLFHLLKLGAGLERGAAVSHYLLDHLSHIKGLMRSLIAFQETLWHEGPDRLTTSVFLGMYWDEGSHQQNELKQAVNMLGSLTTNNQTPQIEKTEDPHRLQVVYGQHGISLATIPEFFRDTNSSMAEYIRHQGEWYGDQHPAILQHPFLNTYGSNKMPVHNSGEMERLVCDPNALNYQPTQPHASKYGTNLIGRVIREAESLNARPNWGSSNGAANHPGPKPPTSPLPLPSRSPSPGPSPDPSMKPGPVRWPLPQPNTPLRTGGNRATGAGSPGNASLARNAHKGGSASGANGKQETNAQIVNNSRGSTIQPQGTGTSLPPTWTSVPPDAQPDNSTSPYPSPGAQPSTHANMPPPRLGMDNSATLDRLLGSTPSQSPRPAQEPGHVVSEGNGNRLASSDDSSNKPLSW